MPAFFDSISDDIASWAMSQPVFFTASAPLAGKHVNISPKGLPADTLKVLSPNLVAYMDSTGSGSESIAHVYENGRLTLMFCSFGPAPRILRFFCTGTVIEWDDPAFDGLLRKMGKIRLPAARAIILLNVFKVQTSCGYGVPRLCTQDGAKGPEPALENRETLSHWGHNKVDKNELLPYQQRWNARSLDGLTGLRSARRDTGETLWVGDLKARGRRILAQQDTLVVGMLVGILLLLLAQLGVGALMPGSISKVLVAS